MPRTGSPPSWTLGATIAVEWRRASGSADDTELARRFACGCQLDTCHVGIATQIETAEEAQLKGLKKFTPQDLERAAESCARFFEALGEEVRELTAQTISRVRGSDEARAGFAAFLAKRPADWSRP